MSASPSEGQGAPSSSSPEPRAVASSLLDALARALRAAYGDRLSEEQLRVLDERLGRNLRMKASLQRFPLRNSDEPDSVFAAFRKEG